MYGCRFLCSLLLRAINLEIELNVKNDKAMSPDSPSGGGQSPSPIIRVQDLTVRYGEDTILQDVTFDVFPGEIMAVLGRSGCGKSTLFKAMIGLVERSAGTVFIDGSIVQAGIEADNERILRKIGVLFQSGALFTSMTVAENVAFPLRQFTKLPHKNIEQLIRIKLSQVGLLGRELYLPAELSGGMQKRVALARAMALDPKILFFDEPSAGLDPVTSAELDETILNITQALGTTIIIVTHELESIFHVASRAIMLDAEERGIIAQGTPEELRQNCSDVRVQQFFRRTSGEMVEKITVPV